MKQRDSVAGFSLFELILSIAMICMLGEIILPNFMNQTTHARSAAMNAMANALDTSVYLVITRYHALHSPTSTSVVLNGKTVIKVEAGFGFPSGEPAGIGLAMKAISGFTPSYGETTRYDLSPSIPNCHVTYNAHTGEVGMVTAGC